MNEEQKEYAEKWRKIDIASLRKKVYSQKFKFEDLTKQNYQDLMILDEYVYGDIFEKITESIERRHREFLSETHPELRDYSYKQFYIKYLESELNKEFLMKIELS